MSLHPISGCDQCAVLPPVDGVPAVFCGRGDGFARTAREGAGGVSGPGALLLPAAQVPDPEPAVRSADGRLAHSARPCPGLPRPVSGAALAQRHPGGPQPLLCQ